MYFMMPSFQMDDKYVLEYEISCSYQSCRNYYRYFLDIPTVPRKRLFLQDLVPCDCFRTSVHFQGLDIYNFVGDTLRFEDPNLSKVSMEYLQSDLIQSNGDI